MLLLLGFRGFQSHWAVARKFRLSVLVIVSVGLLGPLFLAVNQWRVRIPRIPILWAVGRRKFDRPPSMKTEGRRHPRKRAVEVLPV
jgi:hypothetical protein